MGERRRKTRLKLSGSEPSSELMSSNERQCWPQPCLCFSRTPFIVTPLTTSCTLISISLTVLLIVCTSLCNANEDNSRFALRPFQASPQPLSRRQDVLFDLDTPVARLPPNEPNLVPILTAPVPRGSAGHKPSFQRIRLSKPAAQSPARLQQAPPTTHSGFTPIHFTPSESPLTNFQRIAGFNQPSQSPAQPQLIPPALPAIQELPPRQSFRRIKPSSSGGRRIKVKTDSLLPPFSAVTPSRPVEPHSRRFVPNSATPSLPANGAQRLRGRGPVSAQDDDLLHKDNALDNEDNEAIAGDSSAFFGNRVTDSSSGDDGIQFIGSLSRPAPSSTVAPPPTRVKSQPVHTPTIPLTYFTYYTYFTTVLRGPHTAMLSRELVSSTTAVKPIDRSIVTAIEFSEGYIQPSRTQVPLGTKTKGQTTTIYNMASRVQVFNDDLYKVIYATRASLSSSSSSSLQQVEPTRITPLSSSAFVPLSSSKVVSSRVSSRVSSSVARIEPTRSLSRPTLTQSRAPAIAPSRIEDLDKLAKKLLTKYTYFYTFIDGINTRYSTRMEESTAPFTGNLATLAPALDSSIDSEGNLQLLSQKSSTVALGSRAHGRMTTVVNLALNNYVQFDNVRNIKIKPTSQVASSPTMQTPTPRLTPSFEESSALFSSVNQVNSAVLSSQPETPRLSSEILPKSSSVIPSSSSTLVTSSQVRTRPGSSRRPIRVKVKPIRSKLATLSRVSSRIPISSSPLSEQSSSIATSNEVFSASPSLSPALVAVSSTEIVVSSTAIPELSSSFESVFTISPLATPSRKKVAFTIRRPASGNNRHFNRRPSSYLVRSSAVVASSPIAPDSTSSIQLLITPSLASSFADLPTVSYVPPTSSFSPHYVSRSLDLESSVQPASTPVLKPTKASKSRLVVLTRLAGNLNKWNPLYASRIRVSSRKVFKSTALSSDFSSMPPIEPTSVVETIFETTTHTVPFTLGSTTIYTTVEETNSRVVTRSEEPMESSLLSPSFELEMSSATAAVDTLSSLSSTVSFETKTQMTTLTHFNTIYTSGSSIVTSSEQTLSSLFSIAKLAPVSPTVVVETTDSVTTSTLYSKFTYFATLFNGTQTMITPLEEVKTEYLTLREPVTITRTIVPTVDIMPSSTMKPSQPASSAVPMEPLEGSFVTESYSTHTTLTHFITLFSGTRTILSSIEEISPTVMTRTRTVLATELPTASMSASSSPATDSSRLSPSIVEIASEPIMSSSTVAVYSSSLRSSLQETSPEGEIAKTTLLSPSAVSSSTTRSETSVLFNKAQLDSDVASAMPTVLVLGPSTTLVDERESSSTTATIQPGSVIELNDLLQGVQDAGQIGETIKDIVNNIVTRPDVPADDEPTTTTASSAEETTEPSTEGPATTPMSDVNTLVPSFSPTATSEKNTPLLNAIKPDAKFPVYIASQNLPKYYMTSSEQKVIFSTQADGNGEPEQPMSTRYVTSIEKTAKTLTLTSTKVYYTRDSPLTITSIHTTTLPPITYVSTIIGSKTILGTYNSITPTRSSSVEVTTSTAAVTSSVLPAPTTRPRLHRPKNQEQPPLLKAKVTPFLTSQKKPSKPSTKQMAMPPSVFMNASREVDLCNPACNATSKEYCKEDSGKYTCECRPGYVRRPSDKTCQEIKNYLVTVRVSKTAESEVAAHHTGNEVQSFTRVARRLGKGDGIADLQVVSVERSSRMASATMVNLTIQLDPSMNPNVKDDLSKKLSSLGQVEKVVDFDECTSPQHNDCSPRARCINEPGSYRCECLDNFIDLDAFMPGRLCVSEVKNCDYCYNRGDCWRSQASTVCRCHPMFIGRRCEINGLLLAILVPIIAILVIVTIICFLYCSRKLRQRNRRFKNLAAYGPVAVIGGTLDRKAMLGETASESSDPQHRSSHYNSESNPASARGSMARRNGTITNNSAGTRRESEPSLDRSLGTYSCTSGPPQISQILQIPRARVPYSIQPGQVYMW